MRPLARVGGTAYALYLRHTAGSSSTATGKRSLLSLTVESTP